MSQTLQVILVLILAASLLLVGDSTRRVNGCHEANRILAEENARLVAANQILGAELGRVATLKKKVGAANAGLAALILEYQLDLQRAWTECPPLTRI